MSLLGEEFARPHRALEIQLEEDGKVLKFVSLALIPTWNFIIALQTYLLAVVVIYVLAYNKKILGVMMWIFTMDLFFLVDVIATIFFGNNRRIQRFVVYKGHGWKMVVVDLISLLPLSIAYDTYISAENESSLVSHLLLQNRLLRVYRIFQLINSYDLVTRTPYQYALLMLFRFAAYVGLSCHVFACIWSIIPQTQRCEFSRLHCLVKYECRIFSLIIHHWSGDKNEMQTDEERLLCLLATFLGMFLVYGNFFPSVLHVFVRASYASTQYFLKGQRLKRFLKNLGVRQALREKVGKQFRHFWLTGTHEMESESFTRDLPLSLKKEIFTDIYWDAMQHSEIFRDVSRCFKRSLALTMSTQYHQKEDVINFKGKSKTSFMYLVQGTLELMAEENEESPILSFSSGTVLGEVTLFMNVPSKAFLRCRTPCELHTVTQSAVSRLLVRYPRDKKIIYDNFQRRMNIAKTTQWRKEEMIVDRLVGLRLGEEFVLGVEENSDCVKWIKAQWRAIWEAHERQLLVNRANEEGFRIPAWRKEYEIQTRIDVVSNFLNLLVLSNVFEEKKDFVCLKTVFPWAIDPKAEFLVLWQMIVMAAAFFPSFAYPFCTGWLDEFPRWVYTLTVVCTIIFQLDLFLILMTAIKTKHLIITKFSTILLKALKRPTFYMDIVAALPMQLYVELFTGRDIPAVELGLYLMPAMFKSHVFFKPRTKLSESMIWISLLKNSFLSALLLFWTAAFFQLIAIKCAHFCLPWNLTEDSPYNTEFIMNNLLSFFFACSVCMSIPGVVIGESDYNFLILKAVLQLAFFFWMAFLLGDFYVVYSTYINNRLNFQVLYDRIIKYLDKTSISPFVEKRLMKTIMFQWTYNEADDLMSKYPVLQLAPGAMRREIIHDALYTTLKKCPLFEDESDEFLFEVMEKSRLMAVPAGTMIVNYGHQCFHMYLLHKGYCQVNSFLVNDVIGGLCSSTIIGPGLLFPALASFSAARAPISVVCITDCEVLILPVEDFLRILIVHDVFKDVVDVLRSGDLLEKLANNKPAMIHLNVRHTPGYDKKEDFEKPFLKFGRFAKLLQRLFPRRNFFGDPNARIYIIVIQHIYMYYLAFSSLFWPLCFGAFLFQSHILVPILAVTKVIGYVYIIIQFYLPYYNKKGLIITHPLFTMRRYLTTTFFLDVVLNAPIYTVYRYTFRDPLAKDNETMVLVQIIQKMLCIIYFDGFLENLHSFGRNSLFFMVKVCFYLLLVFNAFVNYVLFLLANCTFSGPYVISEITFDEISSFHCRNFLDGQLALAYAEISHWFFAHVTTNTDLCETRGWKVNLFGYTLYFVGWVSYLVFYAWLVANTLVGDTVATIFQERMKSFLMFLREEKTDDKVVEHAITYFEHLWSGSNERYLMEIFDQLTPFLREEFAYPLFRPTFSKTGLFDRVDEGFFRLLSLNATLMRISRGSLIIFKGQVMSEIYFVHKGKCFVFDWFLTLDRGSIIGDIKYTGVMENKIYALTHVELLRFRTDSFFVILKNFYEVEKAYLAIAGRSESFIKSKLVPHNKLRPVDSRDVLNAFGLHIKEFGFEDQSHFEDPENITAKFVHVMREFKRRKFTWTIYPGTYAMYAYNVVLIGTAFVTLIVIPHLCFYGGLMFTAYIFVAVLDVLWVAVIIATFRVGVEDRVKGDIVTESKYMAKKFLRSWDGFFLSLFACIPFELIVVAIKEVPDGTLVGLLRTNRLVRGYYLVKYLHTELRKLKVNFAFFWISLMIYVTLYVNATVMIFLMMTTDRNIVSGMSLTQFERPQRTSLLLAYKSVLDVITSSNFGVIDETTVEQMMFFDTVAVLSAFMKGFIIKNVFAMIYINGLARSKYKGQVTSLETYLKTQDLSPSILKEVLDYKFNLLIMSRSENMPIFLLRAPETLQLEIMNDLYLPVVVNSPLFRHINLNFLKLLTARLRRVIYFPGQKIVEKGDIDNCIYFIQKGEVYVTEQTEEEAYVEYIVDILEEGEEFGRLQGLYLKTPHVKTYRARTVVVILCLASSDWRDLRRSYWQHHNEILATAERLGG